MQVRLIAGYESVANIIIDARIGATYKATKLDSDNDVKSNGHATVTAEEDEDDLEAGPELPPEDEPGGNDEDGRFFGGGVTSNTVNALNYIDQTEQDEVGHFRH